jgi:hypothetical protein
MDFESLKNTVSNLTLYDLKAGVRKVQNGKFFPALPRLADNRSLSTNTPAAVMNYTEMEAKVISVDVSYCQSRSLTSILARSEKQRTTSRGVHLRR